MWENAQAIELWIRNLGKSHNDLVKSKIIPALPLERIYEDSYSLEMKPCPGVQLSFWFETQRFEAIDIALVSQASGTASAYSGTLPLPYSEMRTQEDALSILGKPYKQNGAMSWDDDNFKIGGWDFFELDPELNQNCKIEIQYTEDLHVSLLSFSVMDREG